MEDTKKDKTEEEIEINEDPSTLSEEELDLLAFILNQQERPLHSGL